MGMAIAVLGVDLGKNVRSVAALDASGAAVMRRKVRSETLIGFRRNVRRASSAWRPAAGLISLAGCSPLMVTTSD